MYALDFEYDGQHLSDYGFIICDFDYKSGFSTASAGSNITFNKVSNLIGNRYARTSTKYGECIQSKFGICKNPDLYDDLKISNDEYRDIMRWLNRHEYLKFQVVYEDNYESDPCYYEASFNVEKVKVRDILYGLTLTLETNKPFGYGVEQVFRISVKDTDAQYRVEDNSDEIGHTFPLIKITCNESGDLSIRNDLTECNMAIANCSSGEVIIVDCENKIISSSVVDHDVYDDFNYEYFSLGNSIETRYNFISASLKCDIEIRYLPIIKDTP